VASFDLFFVPFKSYKGTHPISLHYKFRKNQVFFFLLACNRNNKAKQAGWTIKER